MEKTDALKIIQQLADGLDPQTGKAFGADSPYQHPDTVRALFVALRALDAPAAPAAKPRAATTNENAPSNAGKPWSDDEDKTLVAAFDAGKKILDLATAHRRSRFAIEARLAKLGKIEPPANLRGHPATANTHAASDTASYSVQH
jgi:LmbE family N-acetylglucosaminyl deacetylase